MVPVAVMVVAPMPVSAMPTPPTKSAVMLWFAREPPMEIPWPAVRVPTPCVIVLAIVEPLEPLTEIPAPATFAVAGEEFVMVVFANDPPRLIPVPAVRVPTPCVIVLAMVWPLEPLTAMPAPATLLICGDEFVIVVLASDPPRLIPEPAVRVPTPCVIVLAMV